MFLTWWRNYNKPSRGSEFVRLDFLLLSLDSPLPKPRPYFARQKCNDNMGRKLGLFRAAYLVSASCMGSFAFAFDTGVISVSTQYPQRITFHNY